jgi:hypothetical protein
VDDVTILGSDCRIGRIGETTATEKIKLVYTTENVSNVCKVFIGVSHGEFKVPLAFRGDTETQSITVQLPTGVVLKNGDTISFLVDDAELDTEAAAGMILGAQKKFPPVSVRRNVVVGREGKRVVTTSNSAALHFSNYLMNVDARRDDMPLISLDGVKLSAPSILQRCAGDTTPNTGIFCPGQIAQLGPVTYIAARSSSYCVVEGLE